MNKHYQPGYPNPRIFNTYTTTVPKKEEREFLAE